MVLPYVFFTKKCKKWINNRQNIPAYLHVSAVKLFKELWWHLLLREWFNKVYMNVDLACIDRV